MKEKENDGGLNLMNCSRGCSGAIQGHQKTPARIANPQSRQSKPSLHKYETATDTSQQQHIEHT
jgi:hypothetical protein